MAEATDRNLLFGVLALQMGFIDRDVLIEAMNAWSDDPRRPLSAILVEQGALGEGERTLLDMAVENHIERHGDPNSSLAALGAESLTSEVAAGVGGVAGPDAEASRSPLAATIDYAARPAAAGLVGRATSEGGRFRIVQRHARGGLGEVFLARDEQLDREVALKEIQPRYAHDADLRARFVLEAEVTGKLEHPGIVPVYGLGHYEDGRPYYAMRFIRGESLMEAVSRLHGENGTGHDSGERTLVLRKLLGRFVDVCNAVAYAHSRGVIHRDLKPDNIMLGPYGETLLVDWGLAKLVGRDGDEAGEKGDDQPSDAPLRPASAGTSAPTQLGAAVGTLAYMSPEQAAGLVDRLGPASDIYSLGATLYVILAGRLPATGKNFYDVRQEIISGKLPSPRKVNPRIPPALEAICLKAMAYYPRDRYRSAREMAEDIEAWLADEPVRAWREPLRVRAGRWMRRHRTLVGGAAAAVLVALVSLSIGVVLLSEANQRERHAKTLAEQKKEEAQQNFMQTLRAVDKYYLKVSQNPRLKMHALEPFRRDLLASTREFFEQFIKQKPDDPLLRSQWALAHFRLANITDEIGSNQEAIGLLGKAIEIYQDLDRQYPDQSDYQWGLAKSRSNLGVLYLQRGRVKDARAEFLAALSLSEDLAHNDPDAPEYQTDLANLHNNLAKIHVDAQEFDKAEAAYKAALTILRELVRRRPDQAEYQLELAGTYSNMGVVYNLTHRYEEAMAALKAARSIQQRLVQERPNIPDYQSRLATTWDSLANVYSNMDGQFGEAEAAYNSALEIRERLAREHPEVTEYQRGLARGYHNLASLYGNQGRFPEAETALKAARKICEPLAAEHADVPDYQNDLAAMLSNLGHVYRRTERLEEAWVVHKAALQVRKKLADQHADVPKYQSALASTYIGLADLYGSAAEAEAAYKAALEILLRLVGEYPDVAEYQAVLATSHNNLGTFFAINGRLHEAQAAYQAALKIRERLAREYTQATDYAVKLATTYGHTGDVAGELGHPKAALQWSAKAIATLQARPALGNHLAAKAVLCNAHWTRAQALSRLGRHEEACTEWDRGLELDDGSVRALLRLGRAESLAHLGHHTRAVAEVKDLVESFRGDGPSLYRLAAICAVAGAAASKDDSLAAADRDRLARVYGKIAPDILRQAREAGYLDDPDQIEKLNAPRGRGG